MHNPAFRKSENKFSSQLKSRRFRIKRVRVHPSCSPCASEGRTLRSCNLNRRASPRLQRCRSFSSASSHRTHACSASPSYQRQIVFFAGFIMSFLHRYEPPETGVNDALAVERHWLGHSPRVDLAAQSIPFSPRFSVLRIVGITPRISGKQPRGPRSHRLSQPCCSRVGCLSD